MISGIKKWDGKGTLSDYYEKIETSDISEPCSFYTLLHECVHALYYTKPDISVIDNTTNKPYSCAGCRLNSDLNVKTLNPNKNEDNFVEKQAALNEYHYFRKQVTNLYFKKINYDMAIKVENYFRVNLRKLDNSSGNIFIRTSIGHLGLISDQKHIEGYYNKKDTTCFRDRWNNEMKKKKGTSPSNEIKNTYPSYFLDIDTELYSLTKDFVDKLSIFGNAIRNKGKWTIGDSTKIANYWKEKYEQIANKYKNIYDLE